MISRWDEECSRGRNDSVFVRYKGHISELGTSNAGGVLSGNDKLFKKGANENPENCG